MFLIFRFFVNCLVIIFIGKEIPGFVIKNATDAFFFALILSAINAIIRPLIVLLTLPVTVMTLGAFLFVINFFTFYLASEISYGVHFETFTSLFLGALCVWVTGIITSRYIWRVNIY